MRFEKVKKNAFEADMMKWIKSTAYIDEVYDGIQLPERGTKNSAGYDIRTPVGFMLDPNERKVIPTGIKAVFNCWERICQCVFAIHGRTSDNAAAGKRTGGVGSTGA